MNEIDERDTKELIPIREPGSRFFAPSPPAVCVQLGARSHPGKVRPINEDQWLVVKRRRIRDVLMTSLPEGFLPTREESAYVLVVADGVGGSAFGEVASLMALRTGFNLGFTEINWPLKATEQEVLEMFEKFEAYVQKIHGSLLKRIEEEPSLRGMGTTMTVAYTMGLDAFIGHVGDSRVYRFHDGEIQQLTRDQTLAQRLIDQGVFSPESAEARQFRHILLNCLGAGQESVVVDVGHIRLAYGDCLLLCTDGLSDLIGDEQIAETLKSNPVPSDAATALVDLALDKGGHDNITVLVAKYNEPNDSA
jgi:serine/threonine protein phosphatase PrpC